jgi:Type IV secretion system pilin
MVRKLFQIITISAALFLLLPVHFAKADCAADTDCGTGEVCSAGQCVPQPVFQVGSNPEKQGVAGIECALISDPTAHDDCVKCVQSGGTDCAKQESKSVLTSTSSVRDLVFKYVNFALPLLALITFVGFIYAGFLYATAYGSDEQTGKAKKVMIYAIIGVVLVILSYSIVQLFTSQLAAGIQK